MHGDFKLVERASGAGEDRAACLRIALRLVWALPVDTFVTADFPLLLTKLCRQPVE